MVTTKKMKHGFLILIQTEKAHNAMKNLFFFTEEGKVTLSSGEEVILPCLCICKGIIMTDYLQKGPVITGDYYSGLLIKLRSKLVRKGGGKLSNGFSCSMTMPLWPGQNKQLRQQNNVTLKFILSHLVCPPQLAPSDFLLFPNQKKNHSHGTVSITNRSN